MIVSGGYTKLFNSIIASSIWNESDQTRIVWITLLALSDPDGYVAGAIPGLATLARVSVEDCKRALEKLQQPDEYSRSPEYDGRRIEVVDGGWFILNRAKYRDLSYQEDKAERHRLANRRYYQSQKAKVEVNSDQDLDTCNPNRIDSDRVGDKKEKEKEKDKNKNSLSKPENGLDQEASTALRSTTAVPSQVAVRLANLLRDEIRKNAPNYRITPAQERKWAQVADRMLRLDKRTEEEIASLICWVQADEFWRANVLGMDKLREKFDQLQLKRKRSNGVGKPNSEPVPPPAGPSVAEMAQAQLARATAGATPHV